MNECILFTFVSDEANLERLIYQIKKKNYTLKTIINLSRNSQLKIDPAYKSKHLVDYALESGKQFRELSNKWVLGIGNTRLVNGKKLIESFTYREIPVWWFTEIALQEKSFLVIRFIETIKYILNKSEEDVFIIAGDDPLFGWMRTILMKICLSKNMEHLDLESYIIIKKDQAKSTKEVKVLSKVLTSRERIFRRIAFFLSSIPLAVYSLILLNKPKTSINRDKIKQRTAFYMKSLFFLFTFLAFTVKTSQKTSVELPFEEMARSTIKHSIQASSSLSQYYTERIFVNFGKIINKLKGLVKNLLKVMMGRKEQKGKSVQGAILLVCDAGNIKNRRSILNYKRSQYNPYIENLPLVLEDTAKEEKLPVICAYYGNTALKSFMLTDEKSNIYFSDFIEQKHWNIYNAFRKKAIKFSQILKYDKNLKSSLKYDGIDLSYVFIEDMVNYYIESSDAILYIELFSDMIEKIRPSIVVLYNYEGVFRKLVAACLLKKIRSIGIQQALGPYVHALNKLEYGIRNLKNENKYGFPVPEKIALWGTRHKENFLNYGYNNDMLELTGYCRLDTNVKEKPNLDPRVLKRRIGLPANSKVIMFTATLRPLGISVTLEDNFIKTIRELKKITEDFKNTYVLVKPWGGDELDSIVDLIRSHGNNKFIFVAPNTEIHNVELLAMTDIMIGSYSSIFAEAIAMGCDCIFLDYPEARFYDEVEHIKLIDGFVTSIQNPHQVYDAIAKSSNKKSIISTDFNRIFGPLDGLSATRISKMIVSLAKQPLLQDTLVVEETQQNKS